MIGEKFDQVQLYLSEALQSLQLNREDPPTDEQRELIQLYLKQLGRELAGAPDTDPETLDDVRVLIPDLRMIYQAIYAAHAAAEAEDIHQGYRQLAQVSSPLTTQLEAAAKRTRGYIAESSQELP